MVSQLAEGKIALEWETRPLKKGINSSEASSPDSVENKNHSNWGTRCYK